MSKYKYLPLHPETYKLIPNPHPPVQYVPSGKPLQATADLSKYFGAIENQGALGSCSAFAATQWYSAWLVKNNKPWIEYSELAQYWEERNIEGTVNIDSGATLWDAVKVLETFGVMNETDDPYNINAFTNKPDESKFIKGSELPADTVKMIDYSKILEDSLDALNNGYPVLFGFRVFPELEGQEVAMSGVLPMPAANEKSIGGHAVVAFGFDQNQKMLYVRNQWGSGWGNGGCFMMPYDYYKQYTSEAYVIVDQPQPTPQPTPTPAPTPTPSKPKLYHVQVGAFSDKDNADKLLNDLTNAGFHGFIKYE